jgi:integrase/recombinase XerD
VLERSLAGAVPSVAGWRLSGLPKRLEPGAVDALLASCDRSTVIGLRDLAILTVLARLGLRAGECGYRSRLFRAYVAAAAEPQIDDGT